MFLLNQPISGQYFKIFVEILCSKNSGVQGGAHLTLTKNWGEHKAVHLTPN